LLMTPPGDLISHMFYVLSSRGDAIVLICRFFFSSRRRHTRSKRDWSSDVCSSDLRTPHIVIGTPSRVKDLMQSGALDLHLADTVVIDEADLMIDLGFLEEIDQITRALGDRSEERRVGKESRARR